MRHSPRNLRLACDHKGLTHFGGVYFFREFLGVLQFRNFLARQLTYPRRNRRYSLSQMILALVYPLVLGLDRLETVSFWHLPISDWSAELPRSTDVAPILTPRSGLVFAADAPHE